MGKPKKQTTTQRLDPLSQGYVNQQRRQATSASDIALSQPGSFFTGPIQASDVLANVNQFLDPFTQDVIGGVRQEFDQLRAGATTQANQAATRAGSFGGSRHGVAEGVAHGSLGRAQAQQVGGLLSNQFNRAMGQALPFTAAQQAQRQAALQEPLFRQQMAQGFLNRGLGPTSMTQTTVQPGSLLRDIAGVALTAGGAALFGPQGAAAGASVGSQLGGGGGFTAPEFFPQANYNAFSNFGNR